MSENEVNEEGAEQAPDGDLSEALSGGEESFVTEGDGAPKSKSVVVLGAVLAGIVAYYAYFKFVPKSADAALPPPSAETQDADRTIKTFINAGGESIKSMQEMLKNTVKNVE